MVQIIISNRTIDLPDFDKSTYSFEELLNLGYYDNKHIPRDLLPYPSVSGFEKQLKLDIETTFVGTKSQIDAELAKCRDKAKELFKIALDDFRKVYTDKSEEFKRDMFEYYGVANNPKVDKAFSYAYGEGSSEGSCGVHNHFRDVLDLISDDRKYVSLAEITLKRLDGNNCTLQNVQDDVNVWMTKKDIHPEFELGFTAVTVQSLIDKIVELSNPV